MIIRKATLDDLDQIEIIENECFVDPYKREDLIYELTTNPCSTVLVAIIDNKIVGFIDSIPYLTDLQKEFYSRYTTARYEKIIEPAYENVMRLNQEYEADYDESEDFKMTT